MFVVFTGARILGAFMEYNAGFGVCELIELHSGNVSSAEHNVYLTSLRCARNRSPCGSQSKPILQSLRQRPVRRWAHVTLKPAQT